MRVTIELLQGPYHHSPTKAGIQRNIETLQRAIDGKTTAGDFPLLLDTKSILEGIQKELPICN